MLKNILIKCANLLGRDDISTELNKSNKLNEITDNSVKNEIEKLICFYNFVTSLTFETYLNLTFTEKIHSDLNSKIEFYKFSKQPIKIIKIEKDNGEFVKFVSKSSFILTGVSNEPLNITYNFLPDDVKDFDENINYLDLKTMKILCYGIVSEFLASKGKYSESEFWNNKFLFELFKIKNNKERRLKSTFCL